MVYELYTEKGLLLRSAKPTETQNDDKQTQSGIWHIFTHRTVSALGKISPVKFLPDVKITFLTPKHDSDNKAGIGTAGELPALEVCGSTVCLRGTQQEHQTAGGQSGKQEGRGKAGKKQQ